VFAQDKRKSTFVLHQHGQKLRKGYVTKGRRSQCAATAAVHVFLERAQRVDAAGTISDNFSVVVQMELPRVHKGHTPKSLTDMSNCGEVFPMTAVAFIKVNDREKSLYFCYALLPVTI
jgi:hypothetical protein